MREVAKATRFNPAERIQHMVPFVEKLQGLFKVCSVGLRTCIFYYILWFIIDPPSVISLLCLDVGASRAELDKMNLRFLPKPVSIQGARLMPQTEIRQDGQPLRYRLK